MLGVQQLSESCVWGGSATDVLGVQQLSDLVSPVSGEGGPQMCWECSNLVT